MNDWSYVYIIAFILPLILACITTPIFRALAWKLNILDKPLSEGHKMHSDATPLLGGSAVCSSWLLAMAIAFFALKYIPINKPDNFPNIFTKDNPTLVMAITIIFCAVSFVILGLIDDRNPMHALSERAVLPTLRCSITLVT